MGIPDHLFSIDDAGILPDVNFQLKKYPMFLDTAGGDYRLHQDSPFINKGIQDTIIIYNDGQDTLNLPQLDYVGDFD